MCKGGLYMFVIKRLEEYLTKNHTYTSEKSNALLFSTYEEARQLKIVLEGINEDYYSRLEVCEYEA